MTVRMPADTTPPLPLCDWVAGCAGRGQKLSHHLAGYQKRHQRREWSCNFQSHIAIKCFTGPFLRREEKQR